MGDLNCGMNWMDATSSGQVAELNGTQAMVELADWVAEHHGNRLQSIRAKLCCCCCRANLPSYECLVWSPCAMLRRRASFACGKLFKAERIYPELNMYRAMSPNL